MYLLVQRENFLLPNLKPKTHCQIAFNFRKGGSCTLTAQPQTQNTLSDCIQL